MKAEDLKAKAQELRDHATMLDEHARVLERARTLRAHAAQMVAEADAIEAPLQPQSEPAAAAHAVPGATDAAELVREQWSTILPTVH